MERIAIVGLGCAGYHGIRSLREQGFAGQIHVYTETEHAAANPMLTTYYVAGKISRDQMFPFETLEELVEKYHVILHTGSRVKRIRTESKSVILEDGSCEDFDKILIATGARAVSPHLGQKSGGRTFLMRTVSDADRLKEMLDMQSIRSAVIVGASMVGIKVVELLYNRGIHTVMADMADRMFPLACMKETADILERDLRDRGIEILLEKGVDHVEESPDMIKTYLTDGQCLASDILILCIGTRANVELVANTEIIEEEPVRVNRGIIVNEKMETNISGIYAAGDCCEALNVQTGQTMIIGLWANAAEQGRIAGCSMTGGNELYKGSIPNNITHYFNETFIGIGDPNIKGTEYCFRGTNGFTGAVMNNGQLSCVNILGNYRISGMIREYLLNRISGGDEILSLEDEGLLRANDVPEGFIELLKK